MLINKDLINGEIRNYKAIKKKRQRQRKKERKKAETEKERERKKKGRDRVKEKERVGHVQGTGIPNLYSINFKAEKYY